MLTFLTCIRMSIPRADVTKVAALVVPKVHAHRESGSRHPYVLALTGLQGSGKSTWASGLVRELVESHGLRSITISLDDLYHEHKDLVRVREEDPGNKLLLTRGQPGTHDEELGKEFFETLGKIDDKDDLLLPSFDKSQFNGEGDRVLRDRWARIKRNDPIDVLIFEGWCVGFQALSDEEVRSKWEEARADKAHADRDTTRVKEELDFSTATLVSHDLEHLLVINRNLKRYNDTFMGPQHFQYLLHLDTDDLTNVYRWRMQQEHALHAQKGGGMTDDQVVAFVKGYMPAYELYLEKLRQGFFRDTTDRGEKGQLRVLLDRDRRIMRLETV